MLPLFNEEYGRQRPFASGIGGVNGFLTVDQEAGASAAVKVEGFVTAQAEHDPGFLPESGAGGFAGGAALHGEDDELAVAGIAHGGAWLVVTRGIGKELFFAIGDIDLPVVDEYGAAANGSAHLPPFPVDVFEAEDSRKGVPAFCDDGHFFKRIGPHAEAVGEGPGHVRAAPPVD